MIDTPLLGFDEDEEKRETLKIWLYQYFINFQVERLMIIVYNLTVIQIQILKLLELKVQLIIKMKRMSIFMDFTQLEKIFQRNKMKLSYQKLWVKLAEL